MIKLFCSLLSVTLALPAYGYSLSSDGRLRLDIATLKEAQNSGWIPSARNFGNGLLTAGALTAPSAIKARISVEGWDALVRNHNYVLFHSYEELLRLEALHLSPEEFRREALPFLAQLATRVGTKAPLKTGLSPEEFEQAHQVIFSETRKTVQWFQKNAFFSPEFRQHLTRFAVAGVVLVLIGLAFRGYARLKRHSADQPILEAFLESIQEDEDVLFEKAKSDPSLADMIHQLAMALREEKLE